MYFARGVSYPAVSTDAKIINATQNLSIGTHPNNPCEFTTSDENESLHLDIKSENSL